MRSVFFEWKFLFQYYMARFVAKVGHQGGMCLTYNEIELHVDNVDTILSSLLYTIGRVM